MPKKKEEKTDLLKKGFFSNLFDRGDGYCHIHITPKEHEKGQPKGKQETDRDSQKT